MRYRFRYWHKKSQEYIVKDRDEFIKLPEKAFVTEQFTGLLDANKQPIYEGDILQEVDDCEVGIVEWYQETAMFVVNFDGVIHSFDDVHPSLFYVIGNINENQEIADQFEQSRIERLRLAGMEDRI